MKRLLVFVLCFAMLAVLGCGEKAADDSAVFADGDQYEQIGGELKKRVTEGKRLCRWLPFFSWDISSGCLREWEEE